MYIYIIHIYVSHRNFQRWKIQPKKKNSLHKFISRSEMAQEKGSSKTEQKKLSNAENSCPAETTRENEQTSTDIYDSVRLTDWYVMSLEKSDDWTM